MSRQGCLRPDYDFAGTALSVSTDDGKTLEECVELCRGDDQCYAGIHRWIYTFHMSVRVLLLFTS